MLINDALLCINLTKICPDNFLKAGTASNSSVAYAANGLSAKHSSTPKLGLFYKQILDK